MECIVFCVTLHDNQRQMKMMNFRLFIAFFILLFPNVSMAANVVWFDGTTQVTYSTQEKLSPVVGIALDMFASDMQAVTGLPAAARVNAPIEIYQLDLLNNKEFKQIDNLRLPVGQIITKPDAFYIGVKKGKIIVMGSNARGTAYGVLELSRIAGVSPWVWWGDIVPERQQRLVMNEQFSTVQSPAVEHRAIAFDEQDVNLIPWSQATIDRQSAGKRLGPVTYRRLFELMLRLRANTLWNEDVAWDDFTAIKDNVELADNFDLFVGTKTHLFSYVKGKKKSISVHFMLHDDDFGYLTSDSEGVHKRQNDRSALSYHLNAAGRPHDDLWLTTIQPGLVCHELKTAYERGINQLWVVHVTNPKSAIIPLSLAMDLAWNPNTVKRDATNRYLDGVLQQIAGRKAVNRLRPVMQQFYHLTGIRRPEWMGWNRSAGQPRAIQHTALNANAFGDELETYLSDYDKLRKAVQEIEQDVPAMLRDAFFAAAKYPVWAAAAMANKQLQAQEARELARPQSFHHDSEALTSAANSVKAYREIQQLTAYYNDKLAGGKWKGLMNMAPRNLPVFAEPNLPDRLSEQEIKQYATTEVPQSKVNLDGCTVKNACEYVSSTPDVQQIDMLGHSVKAILIPQNGSLVYSFYAERSGNAVLRVALIPTPTDTKHTRLLAVSIDGATPMTIPVETDYRSKDWENNVLQGQVRLNLPINIAKGSHTLTLKAVGATIIVDQWMLDFTPNRAFYIFPIRPAQ